MRGVVVAVALCTAAAACAPPPPPGPVVSPTGVVYEPGTPPRDTRNAQLARLHLRQDRYERALELALDGISDDPANPLHYFLAGAAYARLGRYGEADPAFAEAQRIYPAYELDIEPEREAAWAAAFNAGLEAYAAGDVEVALERWRDATLMTAVAGAEAHRNLASVLALEERYEEAIEVFRDGIAGMSARPATRVLTPPEEQARLDAMREMKRELSSLLLLAERFEEAERELRGLLADDPGSVQLRGDLATALTGLGRRDEAGAIYSRLLAEPSLQATQLFAFGVSLFRASDYRGAAEAFGRLVGLQDRSRDAWFNYVNALFALEDWGTLRDVGHRLIELDELNENAYLITARAHLEAGERDAARALVDRADALPVLLDDLRLHRSGAETSVEGLVLGTGAAEGAQVELRFTFYGGRGEALATATVVVTAPAGEAVGDLRASAPVRASGYSYAVAR